MQKFAVFDIDGTLIRWQLYHTLVDRLAKNGVLGSDVHKQLHEARMRWKRRENNYSFGEYEKVMIACYEAALTNISTETFDQLVVEVIKEYKDQVYTYTRDLVNNLKKSNYFLIAISGSHEELIGHIAQHYGFAAYAGSRYERTDGAFSGKKMVASHHKKQILTDFIKKYQLNEKGSIAVGDSQSDSSILEMVEHPIAFNPDKLLFETAFTKKWGIVIERKNMVYKLEYKDGNYILAEAGKRPVIS